MASSFCSWLANESDRVKLLVNRAVERRCFGQARLGSGGIGVHVDQIIGAPLDPARVALGHQLGDCIAGSGSAPTRSQPDSAKTPG